jgi:hypothetical protein
MESWAEEAINAADNKKPIEVEASKVQSSYLFLRRAAS